MLIARIFPSPTGARKNTTQLTKYPHVLYAKPSNKVYVIIIISIRSDLFSEQVQYGRPPGIKDVLYDDRGNVVAVMKISPKKLPSHRYVAYPSRVILVHQLRGGGGGGGVGVKEAV